MLFKHDLTPTKSNMNNVGPSSAGDKKLKPSEKERPNKKKRTKKDSRAAQLPGMAYKKEGKKSFLLHVGAFPAIFHCKECKNKTCMFDLYLNE